MSKRIYLNVPYEDKFKVQDLGARWDPVLKKWFCSTNTFKRRELIELWGIKETGEKYIAPNNIDG